MAGHLGTQRRAKAGQFIKEIRVLRSSPYDDTICRDLLLAGRILGDGVPAGPAHLIQSLLEELLQLWLETPLSPLRHDIENVFRELVDTEYGAVLIRLACDVELSKEQTLTLARCLGTVHFREGLIALLRDENPMIRRWAAEVLARGGDPCGITALAGLANDENSEIRLFTNQLLVEQNDPRGIVAQLLAKQDDPAEMQSLISNLSRPDLSATDLFEESSSRALSEMASLVELLNSVDSWVRYHAARLLVERDDLRGVAVLTALLDDQDPQVRLAASHVLVERDDQQGVTTLLALLHEERVEIRHLAVWAWSKRNDPRGMTALAALLDDEDLWVRYHAAYALAQRDDPRGMTALIKMHEVEFREILNLYLYLPTWLGYEAFPEMSVLADLLKDGDSWIRFHAARGLVAQDDPRGVATLAALLDDEDSQVRLGAAQVLAKRDDSQGLRALLTLLPEQHPEIRRRAIQTLGNSDHPRVMAALGTLLDDEDSQVRRETSQRLAMWGDPRGMVQLLTEGDYWLVPQVMPLGLPYPLTSGPGLPRATTSGAYAEVPLSDELLEDADPLDELLDDKDTWVCFHAARVLAERDKPRGVAALVTLLDDENPLIRLGAARLLVRRDDPQGITALVTLLNDENSAIRCLAAESLPVERSDPRGVATLAALLDDEDSQVRLGAAQVLAGQDDAQGVRALLTLLPEQQPEIRRRAIQVLGNSDHPRGMAALGTLLDDEDSQVRRETSQRLAMWGDPRGMVQLLTEGDYWLVPQVMPLGPPYPLTSGPGLPRATTSGAYAEVPLSGELLDDKDTWVRFHAARVLAERDKPRGVATLVTLLDDEDPLIRLGAARLLVRRDDETAFEAIRGRLDVMLSETSGLKDVSDHISLPITPFTHLMPFISYGSSGLLLSMADVAYLFLRRHLTPQGDVVRSKRKVWAGKK